MSLIEEEELAIVEKVSLEDRGETKYDFDTMPLSPDTENMEMKLDPELLSQLDNNKFDVYLDANLNKKVGLFRKATIEELMRHSNHLDQPLLNIPSSLNELALQLFKNLQSYMGDRKSSKTPIKHVMKYIRLTINNCEEIKDEAYCQVIKQITDHPNQEKALKGWNLLAIMASCFAPSVFLYKALLYYFRDIIRNNSNPILVQKANYIAIRLYHTFESRRKGIPCEEEVKHIEANKSIIVPINFFSGGATSMPIESYTTIRDLKSCIMRKLKLNITRIPYYAIYEICKKPDRIEERYLDESEKVVDILAIWAQERKMFNDEKKAKADNPAKENETIEFKFYIKIQLYYPYNPEDVDTVTMHFVQTCFDVVTGKFQLTDEQIEKLGAIQLFVNHGNNFEEVKNKVESNVKRYVPPQESSNYEKWKKKLLDCYTTLQYKKKLDAKNAYLDILKENPLFESIQFAATYSKHSTKISNNQAEKLNLQADESCIVAIKPKEVIITDSKRNELQRLPFTQIASWAVNNDMFVIVVSKSKDSYSKYYFNSTQTRLFQTLMDSYASILSGKGVNELLLATQSSAKIFDSLANSKLKDGETERSKYSFVYRTDLD